MEHAIWAVSNTLHRATPPLSQRIVMEYRLFESVLQCLEVTKDEALLVVVMEIVLFAMERGAKLPVTQDGMNPLADQLLKQAGLREKLEQLAEENPEK